MKIAFVYDAVYPWVKGGAEVRIYEMGKRLSAQGHEIHLFGIKWWEGSAVIKYKGMTLHGVCKPKPLYVNGRRSISEALVFAVSLFPELKKEKFDLIDVSVFPYFSCFTAKAVSLLKKTPVILTWHEVWDDYWYEYLGRKKGFFGRTIERIISKLSPNNLAVSEWTAERLETLGVPENLIAVIPNGIDFTRLSNIEPEKGRASAEFENKLYDIIFAGRLIKEKNVDVFINAITLLKADFPKIKCCIVGDGPEKEKLVALTKEKKVYQNFEFPGFQEYEALIKKIKASKILVLPSSREGFGMVVIEAFACGVPVLTVKEKYNAAQSLVENGVNGFVTQLEPGEIASGIRKVLENKTFYRKASEASLDKAKEYDWGQIIEEYTEYIRNTPKKVKIH